jgi:outer membrane protein assembly factor BamA
VKAPLLLASWLLLAPLALAATDAEAMATMERRLPPLLLTPEERLEILEIPDDATLEAAGAVVGEITIRRADVFDTSQPEEDNVLFRTANRLHARTREPVLSNKLLFETGEAYLARRLAETERELRRLDYIYDAWVVPHRVRDGVVDVLVVTRDVWTLAMGVGYERKGGESSPSATLSDSNILGTGKFFDLKFADEPERSTYRFRYQDDALFGSRHRLALLLADNSDGFRRTLDVERPFYSLDTRWSAGARVVDDERVTRLYADGDVVRVFGQQVESFEVRAGLSPGFRDGHAHRFRTGWTYEKHVFTRHPEDPGRPILFPRRIDRTVSYPWVGYERATDRFLETRNLDQLGRTEDYDLGTRFSVRLGYSAESWGAYRDQWVFDSTFHTGYSGGRSLWLVDLFAGGRYGEVADEEDLRMGGVAEVFFRNFGRHQLYSRIEAAIGSNLDPEAQYVLGGESGLRGYPRNIQTGDHRYLLTLEQRFYSDVHLFELAYLGGAVFADVGRAVGGNPRIASEDLGWLKDVGVGLRLSSSRSSRGTMVHFDVAYPLDGGFDSVQWLVTTKESF